MAEDLKTAEEMKPAEDMKKADGLNTAKRSISAAEKRPESYSPLSLAYIGDSVLDLLVKKHYVLNGNMQVQKYHRKVTAVVSAVNQAAFMDANEESLSDEEKAVYHRGRNASVHSKAKNATMAEYKKATGMEAVLGYLYLSGREERLKELVTGLMEFAERK